MTHSPGAQPDYWSVLGLEPGADAPSLKAAFRAQARRVGRCAWRLTG